MAHTLATGFALAALMGSAAFAEMFEIQVLNKAEGRRAWRPAS